jgi:hypothetical protein
MEWAMPIDDELAIRERFERVLSQLQIGPPPVTTVLRKGIVMRIGQRIAVGVTAVTVAGAAAIAGISLAHSHQSSPAQPVSHHHRPVVFTDRIMKLSPVARDGVFAEGSVASEGRTSVWRIWLNSRTGKVYEGTVGSYRWTVGNIERSGHLSGIATIQSTNIEGFGGSYAVVSPKVTSIVLYLSDHERLTEYPVAADGHHWVGELTGLGLYVTREVAYSGRTELGYAVTYYGYSMYLLRPGERGLARQLKTIGSGYMPMNARRYRGWSAVVHAGPWGYCLTWNGASASDSQYCFSPAQVEVPGIKVVERTSPRFGHYLVGTAKPSVADLKLKIAGRPDVVIPVVDVDGVGFCAFTTEHYWDIESWAAYDRAGQELYGGAGAPHVTRPSG